MRDGNKFYDKAVGEPSNLTLDAALEKLHELITAAEEHQMQSIKVLRSKKAPVSGAAMTKSRLKETSHSIAKHSRPAPHHTFSLHGLVHIVNARNIVLYERTNSHPRVMT